MTETELYYVAGLLEGEGSFTLNRSGNKKYLHPKISMSSKDRYVVEKIALLTNNMIYGPYVQRATEMWTWFMTGKKAEELMLELRPLMSPRRQEQIDHVIKNAVTSTRARL